jgi:uncharacterized protein (TIGR00661 family)
VPLVTLDQQSKFLGYEFPSIGAFTPREHRMRLGYFFPKATARFATSFFTLDYAPVDEYPVTIIPPILGCDVKELIPAPVDGYVTVYLSAASHITQSVDELIGLFGQFTNHRFMCFVDAEATHLPENVTLMPNGRADFIECLRQSAAVISTAGHNLITEALYLHVPMFLLPFSHYEQQLNARMITDAGLGSAAEELTSSDLGTFLDNLDAYRQQRRETARVYNEFDGDTVFLDLVESLLTES